jgi:hypothetical protein
LISGEPDLIVFRHGPDMPEEYWSPAYEGVWFNRNTVPNLSWLDAMTDTGDAYAEPTGRFEVREDGAVAEVWEIRLATPNEKSAREYPH